MGAVVCPLSPDGGVGSCSRSDSSHLLRHLLRHLDIGSRYLVIILWIYIFCYFSFSARADSFWFFDFSLRPKSFEIPMRFFLDGAR